MKIISKLIFLTLILFSASQACFSQNQPATSVKAVESPIQPTVNSEIKSATDNGIKIQSNQSLIYFYRLKSFVGSALEPMVLCDDKKIAKMDNGRYFAISITPGKHSCYIGDKKSGFEVDIKSGEFRYVKITLEAGFWIGHGIMTLVQPEQAIFEIKTLKLLGANKIKDRDSVTIFDATKH